MKQVDTILLSFVIMTRNDDYQGNAKWRLEMTLQFLAHNLQRIGKLDRCEILVVDWQSAVPLHEVLVLSDEARSITRFVCATPDSTGHLRFACDFPRPVILNIGIRRALGSYIVQTLGDVLWTTEALSGLFDVILGNSPCCGYDVKQTLLVFGRREIPYEVASASPTVEALTEYMQHYPKDTIPPDCHPYLLVPGDSLMMHRDLWHATRGFDERLVHWGWNDCDLILRMKLMYHVVSCRDLPWLTVYHLNHIAPQEMEQVMQRPNNPWLFNDVTVNDEAWGLGGLSFPEYYDNRCMSAAIATPPAPPVYVSFFRLRHILNLLLFYIRNLKKTRNRCFVYGCIKHIIYQHFKKTITVS